MSKTKVIIEFNKDELSECEISEILEEECPEFHFIYSSGEVDGINVIEFINDPLLIIDAHRIKAALSKYYHRVK